MICLPINFLKNILWPDILWFVEGMILFTDKFLERYFMTNLVEVIQKDLWYPLCMVLDCVWYLCTVYGIYRKSVLKNFAIFTWKHLCWSLFVITLQVFSPATLFRRDSKTGIFLRILGNFEEHLQMAASVLKISQYLSIMSQASKPTCS